MERKHKKMELVDFILAFGYFRITDFWPTVDNTKEKNRGTGGGRTMNLRQQKQH